MLLLALLGGMVVILGGSAGGELPARVRLPVADRPMTLRLALLGTGLAVFLVARPAVAWYLFESGEQEYRAGRLPEAVASFARATAIDPGVTGYHDALARAQLTAYEKTGDLRWLNEAVDELQVGRSLNRQDARFPARLGAVSSLRARRSTNADEQAQYLSQAEAYFDEAVRLDPYTPFSYYELAKMRLAQNKVEEARRLLNQAIAYEPNFLPARALSAELAVRMGNLDLARKEYESIVAVQAKYAGRPLNRLEREFLNIDAGRVGRLVTAQSAS
jgi:tetratricopeptide (TPR) repeat protein